MLDSPSEFPGLEDLVDLGSGNQIDMRPTLLRVLTDLYLQRPAHTAEDERYYTELALRLIDATDLRERVALAERLASYPSAPPAGQRGTAPSARQAPPVPSDQSRR